MTDPRGNAGNAGDYTTLTSYDSRNRKTQVTTLGPFFYKTQWQYDAAGNVTKIIRPDTGVGDAG